MEKNDNGFQGISFEHLDNKLFYTDRSGIFNGLKLSKNTLISIRKTLNALNSILNGYLKVVNNESEDGKIKVLNDDIVVKDSKIVDTMNNNGVNFHELMEMFRRPLANEIGGITLSQKEKTDLDDGVEYFPNIPNAWNNDKNLLYRYSVLARVIKGDPKWRGNIGRFLIELKDDRIYFCEIGKSIGLFDTYGNRADESQENICLHEEGQISMRDVIKKYTNCYDDDKLNHMLNKGLMEYKRDIGILLNKLIPTIGEYEYINKFIKSAGREYSSDLRCFLGLKYGNYWSSTHKKFFGIGDSSWYIYPSSPNLYLDLDLNGIYKCFVRCFKY